MNNLHACLDFSDKLVQARKRNNHERKPKDDSADVFAMQMTGLRLGVKRLKKLISLKRREIKK